MKRILITGGCGFIGSHSADLFLKQNVKVVVLDNLSSGKIAQLDLFHPNLEFIQGDILDYPILCKAVAASDVVLHLAALPSVPQSIENPIESMRVNSLGFLHVLQAIREAQKPIRLVYASSAAVYGCVAQLPCSDEQSLPLVTLSPYALEKANNERYADLYTRLFGLKALGLRYFNVYGTRQDPNSPYSGVISKLIERYKANETISIFGQGTQSRDFIAIADVARANWLAVQSDYCGVLNIGTGVPETLLNLVHYLEAAGKGPATLAFAPERSGDILKSYASTSKAEDALSFRSSIPLSDGIHSLLT